MYAYIHTEILGNAKKSLRGRTEAYTILPMRKKSVEQLVEKASMFLTLFLSGEMYHIIYNPLKDEVYNQMFPGVPIYKITLPCGSVVDQTTLAKIARDKLNIPSTGDLASSF